ncbi:hypothetical protein SALBM311S_05785 [Streptomyces alboniger]
MIGYETVLVTWLRPSFLASHVFSPRTGSFAAACSSFSLALLSAYAPQLTSPATMTVLRPMVRIRLRRSRARSARRISSIRSLRAEEAAFLLVLLMGTSFSPPRGARTRRYVGAGVTRARVGEREPAYVRCT